VVLGKWEGMVNTTPSMADEFGAADGAGEDAAGAADGAPADGAAAAGASGFRILLLDEPTRGVDVGARAEIHGRLRQLAARGVAILLSSAETDEVLALADRVLVLRRGAIAGRLEGDDRTEENLLRLAAGAA